MKFFSSVLRYGIVFTLFLSALIKTMVVYESMQSEMRNIKGLEGKVAIITGANSGLGFETAKQLAAAGAKVILACRNAAKCTDAEKKIKSEYGQSKVLPMDLDLANLDSVKRFAKSFLSKHNRLDYLFNNAAIMMTPYKSIGKKNIEAQHFVNHLGHFALTGLLFEVLEKTEGARVINHSSVMNNRCNTLFVDKVAYTRSSSYEPSNSYGCSKRANRYFTWSLNRKFKNSISVIAHPGWSITSLQHRATGYSTIFGFLPYITHALNTLFAQPAEIGAHPQLYAALHPYLVGGETVGPKYVSFGRAVIETDKFCDLGINAMNFRTESCNTSHLDALWKQSESITGIVY